MKTDMNTIKLIWAVFQNWRALQRKYGFIIGNKAFVRFLIWQFQLRVLNKKIDSVRWIEESRFTISKNNQGITGNLYNGLADPDEMSFLLHYCRPKDIFLDVGANVGAYSILAACVLQLDTHAFEPVSATYNMLTENKSINDDPDNFNIYNLAVGRESGFVRITNGFGPKNMITNSLKDDTSEVEIIALDEFFLGRLQDVVLKLDVEGFEVDVLEGARELFRTSVIKVVLIEMNNSTFELREKDKVAFDFLIEHGMVPVSYNMHKRDLNMIRDKSSIRHNAIFVRDIEDARSRCQSSSTFFNYLANSKI